MATKKAADNNNFDWSVEAFRRRRDEGARRAATTSSAQTGETDFDWSVEAFRRRRDEGARRAATTSSAQTGETDFDWSVEAFRRRRDAAAASSKPTKPTILTTSRAANGAAERVYGNTVPYVSAKDVQRERKKAMAAAFFDASQRAYNPSYAGSTPEEKKAAFMNGYYTSRAAYYNADPDELQKKIDETSEPTEKDKYQKQLSDVRAVEYYSDLPDFEKEIYPNPRAVVERYEEIKKQVENDDGHDPRESRKLQNHLEYLKGKRYSLPGFDLEGEIEKTDKEIKAARNDNESYTANVNRLREKYGDDVGNMVETYFSYDYDNRTSSIIGKELKANIISQIDKEDESLLDDPIEGKLSNLLAYKNDLLTAKKRKERDKLQKDLDAEIAGYKKSPGFKNNKEYKGVGSASGIAAYVVAAANGDRSSAELILRGLNSESDEPDAADYFNMIAGGVGASNATDPGMTTVPDAQENSGKYLGNRNAYEKYLYYQYLSKDEKDVLNVIFNTKGEDAAREYIDSLREIVNERGAREEALAARQQAWKYPVLSSTQSVLTSPWATLKGASAMLSEEDDPNSPLFGTQSYNQAIRAQIAEDLEKKSGGFVSSLYQSGMSAADNVYQMAIAIALTGAMGGFAGAGAEAAELGTSAFQVIVGRSENLMLGIMASGAGTASYQQALANGYGAGESAVRALLSAAAEVVTEKVGIEQFLHAPKGDGVMSVLRGVFQTMLAESSEEVAANWLNRISDELVSVFSGSETEYEKAVNAYIAEGKSYSEAVGLVASDRLKEDGESALAGALSALMLSGTNYAAAVPGAIANDVAGHYDSRFAREDLAGGIADSLGSEFESWKDAKTSDSEKPSGRPSVAYGDTSLQREAESSAAEVESGVPVTLKSGETFGVVSVEGDAGARTFTLSNGETVKASDLNNKVSDVPTGMLLFVADKVNSSRLANAMIEGFEGASSPSEANAYFSAMNRVFKAGADGLSSDEAISAATKGDYTLPSAAIEAAYKAGLQVWSEKSSSAETGTPSIDVNDPAVPLEKRADTVSPAAQNATNSEKNIKNRDVASTKDGVASRLEAIAAEANSHGNGYHYEVRSSEWVKDGKNRTYFSIVETRDNSKHYAEKKYGYFDNVTGEYVPGKGKLDFTFDGRKMSADLNDNAKSAESGDGGRSAADVESAGVENEKTSPQSADADSSPAAVREGAEGKATAAARSAADADSAADLGKSAKSAESVIAETREGKRNAERVDRAAERSDSKKASARAEALDDDMKVVIDVYSKAMGVDVRTVLELPDGAYGKIELAARRITLAANSRNAMSTLIHEDVHLIAALDADAYEDMREVALRYLKETGADVNALVGEKMEAHKSEISGMKSSAQRAYCEEEVVADAYGAIQNAPNASERIARVLSSLGYTETEAKTLRDKIVGIFSKLRDAFRRLLDSLRSRNGGDTVAASKAEAWINSSIEACDAMLDAWSDAHYAIDDARRSGRLDGVKVEGEKFSKPNLYEKKAIDYFGKTYSWSETGYLLTNGSKLDLSGKKFGGRGNSRTVDHREIIDAFDDTNEDRNKIMYKFMRRGNIRIIPETNGINLILPPTDAQYEQLTAFISRARGEVTIDFDSLDYRPNSNNTVETKEYALGTYSGKIIKDIRDYFQNNKEINYSSIKEETRVFYEDLASSSAVSVIDTPEKIKNLPKDELYEYEKGELKRKEYVIRPNYGEVKFSRKGVRESSNYLGTVEEALAYAAVPDVIEKGLEIGYHPNHKHHGFPTNVFSGKVIIDSEPYIMSVVVRDTEGLRYRTHQIYDIDDTEMYLYRIGSSNETTAAPTNARVNPSASTATNNNITDPDENVKSQKSDSVDEIRELEKKLKERDRKIGRLEGKVKEQRTLLSSLKRGLDVFSASIPSYSEVENFVEQYVSDSHSDKQLGRAGKTKLIGQLIEAMQTLKAADNSTDYAAAYNKFRAAAKSIVDNASREGSEYSGDVPYKEIVNTVNRMYVPKEMRGDVRYFRDGKWGDVRKHFFARGLNLTSDSTAMSADMIVRELSEQFPEFFSESVNDWSTEGGALVSLLDLYDRSWEALHEKYNPFFESPSWSDDDTSYGMDMTIEHLGSREAAVNEVYDSVARDLMRGMANVKDVKTVDGAYREAYAEAQRYFNDTVERINEQHRNAMREFRLSTTRDANARIEATREYLRTGELHDKVRRQVKRLQKKVVETRKHNMPVDLLDIGLGMLDVLQPGYNLTTEAGRKFQMLKNNLQMWRLLRGNPENLASVQLTEDEAARMDNYMNELEDIIDEAEKTVNGTLISKMDFRQSEKVYDIVKRFIDVLNNATEQVGAAERRSNYECATKAAAEVKANVTKTAFGQNHMLLTRAAWRILEFIGGYDDDSYFKGLSDDIRARERSANKWWSDARHPFNRLMGADEYRDMSRAERREYKKKYKQFVSEYVDVGFVDVNGHAVKFTHAQLAQIYMTHLREEASNGRESHLFDGGIEVAPNEDLEVGRTSFERQELQRVRHVDAEMIDRIENELTDFDREFIAAAQQFFDRVSYDELNKVHMALFGVPLPKSKNYITYMVDRGFVKDQNSVDIKNLRENRMLENSGRYKQTTAHSPAPLIITSLPEVIDAMMDEVRQQMSYAIPNRNFLKINNLIVNQETGESVNRLLNSRWRNIAGSGPVKGLFGKGKGTAKGVNVVMQLMTDLQTPRQRDDSFFDRATNKMITATLYTNISVALKQLGSITNTGLYIGQKAVASIWGRLPYVMKNYRTIIAEIDEHTGAHAIRRAGYSIPEFDAAKKKAPLAEKIPGHNLIQYNDCIATAAIWLGCKTEVNGTLKSSGIERGSEAYWKAVTDLYNRVIEETQPMYSTLYRSEMQKSTNAVMRYSYMFRTQQMQEFGIVMSAANEWSAKSKRAAAAAKAAEEAERAYRAADADHKESAREAWEDAKADAQKASDEAKAARKKFRHAVGSTMRAAVTITVLSAIINAILRRNKDWKDENGEITLESFLEAQGSNFLENIFSFMAPVLAPIGAWEVGEDVVDAIKGEKISASGLDFNNAPFYELVKKFAKAGYGTLNSVSALRKSVDNETFAKEFDESLGHYFETFVLGKESDNVALSMAGSLRNVLKTLADISGIPGSNIDAYIQATRNWYTDIKNGDFGKFEADANRTAAQTYNIVFEALVSGDADKADEYKAKAEELGRDDDDFNTEMKKRLKERFAETGEIDPDGGNRDEIIDRYTGLGFRDYVVAQAVDGALSEDEEKVDSPYSDNEVYRAVVDGDAAKLDEIADWYRTNGYNLPRTKLSKEFRSVWERFDSEEKEQIKDMLINHFGYDEKYKFYEWEYDFTPYKSVVSAAGAKIADGDLSTLSNDALDFMKNYAENQVSIGVEKEKARENAASYVKNTEYGFGAYLKEAYVSGNAATRQAIRRAMNDMRDLDGKRLYGTYSDIVDKTNKWLKG